MLIKLQEQAAQSGEEREVVRQQVEILTGELAGSRQEVQSLTEAQGVLRLELAAAKEAVEKVARDVEAEEASKEVCHPPPPFFPFRCKLFLLLHKRIEGWVFCRQRPDRWSWWRGGGCSNGRYHCLFAFYAFQNYRKRGIGEHLHLNGSYKIAKNSVWAIMQSLGGFGRALHLA